MPASHKSRRLLQKNSQSSSQLIFILPFLVSQSSFQPTPNLPFQWVVE